MKILIVDDHELVRSGLARIVAEEFPMAEIQEASNGMEAEKLVRKGQFDLLIMDLSMPEKTGLEVLKQLRSEANRIPILILSIHPENQYALRVLKAGGNGYISKDALRVDFVVALNNALKGKKYISAEALEQIASHLDDDLNKEKHERITDREMQVLKLIASGKTVSAIADILSLSVPTISTYRHRLLEKMNFKNNSELTIYAINNKIV